MSSPPSVVLPPALRALVSLSGVLRLRGQLEGTRVAGTATLSHREQAEHIHGKLTEQLQTLRFLEFELRQRHAQDPDERSRARAVATALEHLQQAMDALEIAGRK